MKNRIKHLKIKIKSLAAEARIIRFEEHKSKDPLEKRSLSLHRIHDVRDEARWSQIAYAFLRGREYAQIESANSSRVDWQRVKKIIDSFGVSYSYDISYKGFEQLKDEQEELYQLWLNRTKEYINASSKKPA